MRKSLNRNLESKSTDVMKQGIIRNNANMVKQMKQYFLVYFVVVEKLTFFGDLDDLLDR